MYITIETKLGPIEIMQEDGEDDLTIFLDKEVAKKTNVCCFHSGVPGIVGPDVVFSVEETLEQIRKEACKAASLF